MALPAWLSSKAVLRLRRKLPDWGQAHILEIAKQKFGTDQLSKEQINQLVQVLSEGGIAKPNLSPSTTAQATGASAADREITLSPNRGGIKSHTEHFLSGSHVGLRFGCAEDLTGWALGLLWNAKEPWKKTYSTWLKSQTVLNFAVHPGARLAPDLETLIVRRLRGLARETMALPTRPSIRHAFWGFNEGDVVRANLRALVEAYRQNRPLKKGKYRVLAKAPFKTLGHPDPNLKLKVVSVKPNMETPPTVVFEEI